MAIHNQSQISCQDMVIHRDKEHGLFLILHLSPSASPEECVNSLQKLQSHVHRISPIETRNNDNEIIAGIAFGDKFLKEVYPDATEAGVEPFKYKQRKGETALMPATGGDILIHAVCAEKGKLFQLVQAVLGDIPSSAVQSVEETYGFVYRGGRDISGFIDGTENPADEDERVEVAVSVKTGGSYVLAQRWIHDLKKINAKSEKVMESYVGRTRMESHEIQPVTLDSHVGRMTHGLSEMEADERRIVRHSLPYGKVSGECGLFFLAYSKTLSTLDWMLDRMTGLTPEKAEDGIFNFTRPVTGAFFYSPSRQELSKIFKRQTTPNVEA